MQKRIAFSLPVLVLLWGCAGSVGPGSNPPPREEVRNVILMIADGAGAGIWTAASFTDRPLAVKSMPVVGLLDTRSATHRVTDSAAGATAYATGIRGANRTLSVGPPSACPIPRSDVFAGEWPQGCEPLESWFRLARTRGRAAGIVTTAAVVDATPAAFVTSLPSRYWYETLADQYADARLDVMLGGGSRYFSAADRSDSRDVMAEMCVEAACVWTAAELADYRADPRPLYGWFAEADMDEHEVRPVTLPAMVDAALQRLSLAPDGFVAVFESEATDNTGHNNRPLERATADIIEFDEAVAVALAFARRTPGTLVVVTSDHDTGGFSLTPAGADFELAYTTGGHTGAVVPLFAEGPASERFAGFRDNTHVGATLMEIVRGW